MQTDVRTALSSRTQRRNERELALGTFSHTEPVPEAVAPASLHEIFEETARRFPHRVAIEHRARRLTYAELDALSERVADGLRELSIGPGHRVAIQMERSIETHAALLGIMKAGAAYVPLDIECPDDRVRFILSDARVSLIVRSTALVGAGCRVVDFALLVAGGAGRPAPGRASAQDACYVIYTSGSTGRPKGVEIAHRSAAHLVRVEQRMFGVVPSDRVLQGFSLSFDAAVEEIWLAFAAGATLVVVDKARLLESFGSVVTHEALTVVSTVPTLLASVREPMPRLRLLVVGGEACPQSLVERFARGRRMVNTYGPTEATVIATATDLRPGAPVTIGKPIANYRVYLLGPNKQPVAPGTVGQIHIGGPGLALGYVGHASTLPSPFVTCPFAGEWGAPARLYATGDLGRHTASGDIEFLGRADQQVKLRGVRIELGEVEEAVASLDGVAQCVVALQRIAEEDTLVAYVVLRPLARRNETHWSRELRAKLPTAMVPTHWEILARVPTLPSGKVDRAALPKPSARVVSAVAPKGDALEQRIARAFGESTGVRGVTSEQDFFVDLGGHSLLAARLVSRLRADPELPTLSLRDVYDHPTPRALARFVTSTRSSRASQATPVASVSARRPSKRAVAAQAVGVHGLAALHAAQWLGPYLAFLALRRAECPTPWAALLSVCALLAIHPCMLLAAVAIKWLVVGRYRAGSFPVWGQAHLRHWFVDRVLALAPIESLRGTPLLNVYLRMLGARIGADVTIATTRLNAFDLLSVEDGATLSIDAQVTPATLRGGELVLGAVTIGARSVVGPRATVVSNEHIPSDSEVAPLGHACDATPPTPRAHARAERPSYWRFVAGALGLQVVPVAAILPGLAVLDALEPSLGSAHLLAAPAVALSFVLLVCAQLVVLKRALGKTSSGTHSLSSRAYFKHWLFAQAQRASFEWVGSLYATVYTPWLFRLLGAKVERHAELSTASDFEPDLLHVGADSFVADTVSLGAPRLGAGELVLSHTRIGQGAFVGNGAVVPSGASVGDGTLIGCMSRAPLFAPDRSSWMGVPPLRLSRRQASAAFSTESTFRPSRRLVALRALIEGVRVIAPTTGVIVFVHAFVALGERLASKGPLVLLALPTLYLALAAAMACVVILAKWCLVGRHRMRETPLWSDFVWRTELATSLHENLVDPMLNELLKGTPWLPWFFRALGAKVGSDVVMMSTQLTEYDLVQIGDGACLDDDCTLQTHLFEDRVMKTSTVRVGAGCTVGAGSVVLYDTTMAPGSVLEAGSLLMKGEALPPSTAWVGIPASARSRGIVERSLPWAAAAVFALALGSALAVASRDPVGYEASNRVDDLPSAHRRPLAGGGLL